MSKEIDLLQLFSNIFPILVSIIALFFSIKTLKNGIREKIFETQLYHIRELFTLIIRFSQYIDYSLSPDIKSYLNKNDTKDKIIHIYLDFDIKLKECKFLLPKSIYHLLFNQKFQMECIIESLDKENFEIIRSRFFLDLIEMEKKLKKKFNIKKSIKENINIFK